MSQNRILNRIGNKLREESRDIVEAKLPDRLRALAERLACVDERRELENGHSRN